MSKQEMRDSQALLAELRPPCAFCKQSSFSGLYYWRTLGEGWEGYVCETCAMKRGNSTKSAS
jgi:hypothetical protein